MTARPWLAVVMLALLALVALLPQAERFADDRLETALTRSLTAFALARSLDAVISVAQGTEVAIEPVGIGVTLAPGQVLDPVNDLVEQFSSLLLFASASLGVQVLLLGIGAWWPLKVVTAGGVAVIALCALFRRTSPVWLHWLVALLLLLRFAVPLSVLASEACWRLLLAGPFQTAQAELVSGSELLSAEAEVEAIVPSEQDSSWKSRAERWWQNTRSQLDPSERLARIEDAASGLAHRIVELIAVFMLESLIFPLLFLTLCVRALPLVARGLGGAGLRAEG